MYDDKKLNIVINGVNLQGRTRSVLAHPDTLNTIVDAVANGGSLLDLCSTWNVRYSDIIQWIYKEEDRKIWYENAIRARGEWFIQRVLKEIRDIGTVDLRDAYDDAGCLKDVKDIPADVAASIARIEVFEECQGTGKDRKYIGRTKKVIFNDKIKALELIGKNFYMFVDRAVNTTAVTVTHKVEQIDLDERIKKITHATVTVMEAQRIATDKTDTPTE